MADVNEGSQSPPIEVRNSSVHGRGVFSTRSIKKGERIIEYLGERVSHAEADKRYESKDENDSHTFLFIVDSKTVIDAGVDGNDARFFNQSCDPNCESTVEKRRVFIDALRDIEAGEELTYDYQIYLEEGDPDGIEQVFACRCGSPKCRGTMLWPMEPKNKKRKKKSAGTQAKKKQPGVVAKSGGKGKKKGKKKSAAGTKGSARGKSSTKGKSTGGRPRGKTAPAKVAKKKSRRR